ncbi:hypothetical protein L596_014928 [Steinernema carpocapsae]|uniref:Uncharacterized protein n=1 Tax=Steinernema carpocapsae TaxID=34508 RepID=A0A4U5NDZ5_STECR|nr:hypothetical protein L596_014928 [Steinernema carpocapsae]
MEKLRFVFDLSHKVENISSREVFIVANAQNVKQLFPNWTKLSHLDEGRYEVFDLNMPIKLINREKNEAAYKLDPPLSEVGIFEGRAIGRQLHDRKIRNPVVFTAPNLSSIQTASEIAKTFNGITKIRIEPGISTRQSKKCSEVFFSQQKLVNAGFPVDLGYESSDFETSEDWGEVQKCVKRSFLRCIDQSTAGNAIFVTDRAATKILTHLCFGIPKSTLKIPQEEWHQRAYRSYPSGCVVAFKRDRYDKDIFHPTAGVVLTSSFRTTALDIDEDAFRRGWAPKIPRNPIMECETQIEERTIN